MIKIKCLNNNNNCLICGQPVGKNGTQCQNKSKHYVHYMCLGCDDQKINDIKSGHVAVLCACRKCPFTKEIQTDLDDEDDADCSVDSFRIPPVIDFRKLPANCRLSPAKETQSSCVTPCIEECTSVEDEQEEDIDDNEPQKCCPCSGIITIALKNDIAKEKHKVTKLKKSFIPCKIPDCEGYKDIDVCVVEDNADGEDSNDKCDQNTFTSSIENCSETLAEAEQELHKELESMKTVYRDTKSPKSPNCGIKKKAQKIATSDSLKHALNHALEKHCVKGSESAMFVRPKVTDQSTIDVLESVCHTVKQLHKQIRQLMCRIIISKEPTQN